MVNFTYLATEGNALTQKNINEEIFDELLANPLLANIAEALKRTTSDDSRLPILQKHINNFTAKNTFDYFIHKDLRGFLNRELDFFIKNEIMHLDDIENESAAKVEQYLGKIKVLRAVAHKIIDFLASIENFQKKLWLKKKFVLETNYCITLDRVPEGLYSEIVKNKAQHDEWIKLFAIDEIRGEELGSVPYSNPLTIEFLKANPFLVLDTQFFSTEFKYKLLASIDNLDENTNGVLINADNFHILNLLQEKYKKQIPCVYIDPPYNTIHSEILYKNNYKHSTWLSLINNTLSLVENLFHSDFSFGLAIDDFEYTNLSKLLDMNFSNLEKSTIVVNHHPQGAGGRLSRTHEYYIVISKADAPAYLGFKKEDYDEDRCFMRSGTAENNFRYGRWKSFYALLYDEKNKKFVDIEEPVELGKSYPKGRTAQGYLRIYPINSRGEERVWRSSYKTGRKRIKNNELFLSDGGTVYQTIQHENKRELLFSNWIDPKFNAGVYGANLLKDFGLGTQFDYPKSINTLETAIEMQSFGNNKTWVLDYFAGSGTTGHAVINLNRQDGGDRKYILCEMGKYFDTVTKPRIAKVVYSEDWKDGKPKSRKGSSHMFKYVRLESYEDCLDNLKFDRTKGQDDWLDNNPSAREDYMIKYMMDLETKDSILDIKKFETPFDYQINITRDGEIKQVNVDLVETFNFLIGLNVDHIEMLRDVLVVEGTTRAGEKTLVLWRNTNKTDSDALDSWFKKCKYSTLDAEFDVIYVNGDNNLENLRRDDQTWKVRLTEAEFQKRMFDVQDVK